jgi:hypothetical protein
MEGRTKQARAYAWMLELTEFPIAERSQAIRGAELFFDRGWPNNHFTVAMAARAGMGLVPPVYEGIGSEGRYFENIKDLTGSAGSTRQLSAPDVAPNGAGERAVEGRADTEGRIEWHPIRGEEARGNVEEVRM